MYMDRSLDIILPEKYLQVSGLQTRTVWWGGKEHECAPRQFFTDNGIWFNEMTNGKIYELLLSRTNISRPLMISLDRKEHNVGNIIVSGELDSFFDRLRNFDFEMYLWKDDEAVDSEYIIQKDTDLSALLKNSLALERNIRMIRNKGV